MCEHESPAVTGKDRAMCLIELQRTLAENRRQTRDIEMRINIALWTLIAAAVWFFHGKVKLSKDCNWIWLIIIGVLICLGHFLLWMRPIQKSEDRDANKIMKWVRIVEVECGLPQPAITEETSGWKWIFFETLFTAILLLIATIALWK